MTLIKIRQSQIVSSYGPGSLVDLPDYAVLVAGLDHWAGNGQLVPEPRLLAYLRRKMKLPALELRAPPVPDREDQLGIGIVAWQFPEWFIAQYEEKDNRYGRSRPLVHRRMLVRGRYQGELASGKQKRKDWPVVPMRFVQACPNGHVSDIEWPKLIHGEGVACGGQLWLNEQGTTGDLSDLFLRCDGCDRPRLPLIRLQNYSEDNSPLGVCRGSRPWLGPQASEACIGPNGTPHRNRLLIRHASNAYFPITERAISIPDHDELLRKAVDVLWDDFLSVAESVSDVKRERKKQRVQQALDGFTDAEVWAECTRRQSGDDGGQRGLKEVELDTFLSVPAELGDDKPDGDFYARRLPLDRDRNAPLNSIEQVVLAHRLREVVTELEFTRFEAPALPVDSEVDLTVGHASLALDLRWLPAYENRGEGVFLALNPQRVIDWAATPAVIRRAGNFQAGIDATFKRQIPKERVQQIYMPYIMPHSLAHLLLTAISLECGYSAASIRERIYDGAACHGCLLIAEPSCERRNELLDRSLVVPTVDDSEAAFFKGWT